MRGYAENDVAHYQMAHLGSQSSLRDNWRGVRYAHKPGRQAFGE